MWMKIYGKFLRKVKQWGAQQEALCKSDYCNGNNEFLQNFNQKLVIYLQRDSEYASRKCGHQCICKSYFDNRGDINIKNCIVRRS